ncbi:hypothetical protein ACFLTH_14235 [Bacteroidota bacterium]
MTKFLRPGDPRDIFAARWELEFENVFHFKELYRMAHEWLLEHEWKDPEGGENWEYYYYEKIYPPDGLKEHRTWWRVVQTPNKSQYVRYFMQINWRSLFMKQVEVVSNGKKYKSWRGSLVMYCEIWLQLDYMNKWKNHPFLKGFDKFFRNRIYKEHWEEHKLECYRKCYNFNRELKKFYQVKSPYKEPDLFRQPKGVPKEEKATQ